MRIKILLGVLAVALWASGVEAQTATLCPGLGNISLQPYNHEQITVSTTAVGFTTTKTSNGSSTQPTTRQAIVAIVSVQTNPIRFLDDGFSPTSSVGQPVAAGSVIVVCGRNTVQQIKFIRSGSADSTLDVSYYEAQQ